MTERPDPLAPPEGYGSQPAQLDQPDLDTCSVIVRPQQHCPREVTVIWHMGCQLGEHVGPVPYCTGHATWMAQEYIRGRARCGQCGGQIKVLRITGRDGGERPVPVDERLISAVREVFGT